MRYENLGQGSQFPYPQHDLPAEKKGKDWCMQYAKAAYYDFQYSYPKGVFASNGGVSYSVPASTPTWFNRNTGQTWLGNCSNVSIYNRVLTAQEIQQNFNATRSRFGI